MSENEMGNRGSKSVFLLNTVKEQRADGSWCINNNLIHLRCALTGCESSYPIKIPSKQLINKIKKKKFSTLSHNSNSKLNP